MKKFARVISIMAAVLLMTCSVNAEGLFVEIIGKTDNTAFGATVLVLNKDTNISNIKSEDIKYVNQSNINADGTYSIKLPLNLDYDNLSIHSNMGDIKLPAASEYASIIYVSASGSDTNSGLTQDAPVATLATAYSKAKMPAKIVLLTNLTYSNPTKNYEGLLAIEGASKDIELALPATVNLYGDLTIDNLKTTTAQTTENPTTSIRARGYALTIGENVSSEHRLTVYGGDLYKDVNGDTNITLLGGKYITIYGGCQYGGVVKGSTHVTIGGNVNKGDGIDDENKTTISPCYAYGGGFQGEVEGDTNITIKGNAVVKYLAGAGRQETNVKSANVFIEGGKVMNVYGGSLETEISTNTHITMTGGLVEAIFGGSQSTNMTGNTYVTLLGGDVSRRVYTGCYNEWSLSWSSKCQVIGTTNLVIGPNMKLNTKTELASGNQDNRGVFAGSRQSKSGFADKETNTVIFLDGCYEKQKDVMGEKSSWTGTFGSFAHYTVNAGVGGKVAGTDQAGTVKVEPDKGKHAVSGGNTIVGDTMTVTKSAVTTVTFEDDDVDFFLKSLETEESADGITANVGLTAKNTNNEPYVLVAVYDSDDENKLIAVGRQPTSPSRTIESIKLNVNLEAGKTYIVKAMIWNKDVQPLTSTYLINLKK